MRLAFVAHHAAARHGTAAGRQLWAVGEALRSQGHDVTAWCWRQDRPRLDMASWCEWRPLPAEPGWRTRGRALLWPRSDIVRAGWRPPTGAVAVADDPGSFAAVAPTPLNVATVHYSVWLDRCALRDWSLPELQDLRAERRAARNATVAWALSPRVQSALRHGEFVAGTVPVPEPVAPIDPPVAGLLADWRWPPNVVALRTLLAAWPSVADAVPGATLLLAGRGDPEVGVGGGVQWLGEVADAGQFLARLAVFVFPCPPTSGPKMKVLDALAHGVAVLTTPPGVEGLRLRAGVTVVPDVRMLAPALVELLRQPEVRAPRAAAGRESFLLGNAPALAAAERVATIRAAMAAA